MIISFIAIRIIYFNFSIRPKFAQLVTEFPHFAAFSVFFLERDTGFESSLVICHFLSSQVAAHDAYRCGGGGGCAKLAS